MKPRQIALGLSLVATLSATWWAAQQESQPDKARPAAERRHAPSLPRSVIATAEASSAFQPLPARTALAPEGAHFAAPLSFRPPPPPPPAPLPPQAPPLPFRFIGAIDDAGERSAMLMDGNRLHIVRSGDEIDSRYRVERVDAAAIEFTYLPLKQRQILPVANS